MTEWHELKVDLPPKEVKTIFHNSTFTECMEKTVDTLSLRNHKACHAQS